MSKKKNKATRSDHLQTLKIGSRVRCTDDGVMGRIVWANAVSVKVKWDDGEQVTWKRDSLATRPIEILDDETATASEPKAVQPQTAATAEEANKEEALVTTPEVLTTELILDAPAPERTPAATPEPIPEMARPEPTPAVPLPEPTPAEPLPAAAETAVSENVASEPVATDSTPTERQRSRKGKQSADSTTAKKLSALDAAAKVLADAGKPLSCHEMIDRMAATGLWRSPGGRTPSATLYSAILRELATKGNNSRFAKVGRGQFAYHAQE